MSRIYALLGAPVAQSLSPVFQQAGFEALGLVASYGVEEVDAQGMAAAAARVREGALWGANITVPHKRLAHTLADVSSPVAGTIGAANTWCLREGQLTAFNTDAGGLRVALRLLELAGATRAVVLGSGGAANAALFALADTGASVIARDLESACALWAPSGRTRRCAVWGSAAGRELLAEADLVIDATSLAHADSDVALAAYRGLGLADLRPTASVYSLSYGPGLTPLRHALPVGIGVHDGLSMLLLQGALSFRIWTAESPPLAKMSEALQRAVCEPLAWGDRLGGDAAADVVAQLEQVAV